VENSKIKLDIERIMTQLGLSKGGANPKPAAQQDPDSRIPAEEDELKVERKL
jgi:hypothetical protein